MAKITVRTLGNTTGNYLQESEITNILKRVETYLAQDTEGRFINLKTLNNRLKALGRIIEQGYTIYQTTKSIRENGVYLRKGYSTDKPKEGNAVIANYFDSAKKDIDKQELRRATAEAYYIIMTFREKLLNEKINYTIYIGDNNSPDNAVTLIVSEENILKLMAFTASGINIRQISDDAIIKIKKIIESNPDEDLGFELDNAKADIYRQFVPAILSQDFEKVGSYQKVLYNLIDGELKNYRSHLLTKESLKDPDNHKTRHRVSFNMGHISEAFDVGYDSLYYNKENVSYNYDTLRKKFYDNLMYDSIKATKGGDNAFDILNQSSVKAFNASLYNIATIYGDLVQLTDAIDSLYDNFEQRLKSQISNLFISDVKYKNAIKNVGNKSAESALQEALKKLETIS